MPSNLNLKKVSNKRIPTETSEKFDSCRLLQVLQKNMAGFA